MIGTELVLVGIELVLSGMELQDVSGFIEIRSECACNRKCVKSVLGLMLMDPAFMAMSNVLGKH